MSATTELLSQYGISFTEAKDFVYANLATPEVIYTAAAQYSVTFAMLAEIYGQGVTEGQAKEFFAGAGFDTQGSTPVQEGAQGNVSNSSASEQNSQSHQIATVTDLPTTATAYVGAVWSDAESWSAATPVTYNFPSSIPLDHGNEGSETSVGWRTLDTTEQAAMDFVAASQNRFIDLDLTKSASSAADIRVVAVSQDADTEAFAYYPGSGIGGDVFLNANGGSDDEYYYQENGFGVHTLAHELGHAMGLKHTFSGSETLPTNMDNLYYSIMTYTSVGNYEVKAADDGSRYHTYTVDAYRTDLGIFDVAALQSIYGADMSTNTGDTMYVYNESERKFETAGGHYLTIWDAGGSDTLDVSDAAYSSVINLSDYSLSSISQRSVQDEALEVANDAGLGSSQEIEFIQDFISSLEEQAFLNKNNLGIAKGVVIENVITDKGDDQVFDNLVDNSIFTGSGNDIITLGSGGNDLVDGGTGTDYVVLNMESSSVDTYQDADGLHLAGDGFSATLVGVEFIEYSDVTLVIA